MVRKFIAAAGHQSALSGSLELRHNKNAKQIYEFTV